MKFQNLLNKSAIRFKDRQISVIIKEDTYLSNSTKKLGDFFLKKFLKTFYSAINGLF